MKILGIETSCDETAAAVVEAGAARHGGLARVLSNVIYSQIDIHKQWGGVVPEVAAREHAVKIIPVIDEALNKASIPPLTKGRWSAGWRTGGVIDAIAVAAGPGLITSLMVGVETAKALAYAWGVPLVGVNHIEAHIYANFISANSQAESASRQTKQISDIEFPALVLTVSGGHTMLVLMHGHDRLETIGITRDDAAGEAFDKGAKLMGLGYPGGPLISAEAEKFSIFQPKAGPPRADNFQFPNNTEFKNSEKANNIKLPRPMINSNNFDFSFSGLKTALRYSLEKDPAWRDKIPEYCHEYQQAIVDVLLHKTIRAAQHFRAKTIMLAGGVVANRELRKQFAEKMSLDLPLVKYSIPDIKYTTDNAAMVAAAGYFRFRAGKTSDWRELSADCGLEI